MSMSSILLLLFMTVQCCIGEEQQPVRQTKNGAVAGVIQIGFPKGNVEVFYGIPFAQPPVGDLRFEDPEPHSKWTGVRQATKLPHFCHQIDGLKDYILARRPGLNESSEDCLYLNIFIPVNNDVGKMSVFLFIHGGSHIVGTGLMYDGGYLASHGQIVVVTMNYRLAALGFLGTGESEFRGNYGMMDQIMAMTWIKNNIANFKGLPDKVTVLGIGSGAFDVGLHLISPLSKGLFHALISQSGPPTTTLAWKNLRADRREEVRNVSHTLGCTYSTLRDMKQCLKGVPVIDIMKGGSTYKVYDSYEFAALVDGHFLPDEPEILLMKKKFNTKNYVIGYTTSEGDFYADSGYLPSMISLLEDYRVAPTHVNVSDTLQFEYTDWTRPNEESSKRISSSNLMSDALFKVDSIVTANLASDGGVKVYMYQWDHAPLKSINPGVIDYKDWMVAPHGFDMFYLFGWPLADYNLFNFTDLDKNMSLAMMETWCNYVKHGVLSPTLSLDQNREQTYDTTNKTYLRFHAENGHPGVTVEHNPLPRQVYFWRTYLPQLTEQLFQARPQTTVTTPTSSANLVGCYLTRWSCYLAMIILSCIAIC